MTLDDEDLPTDMAGAIRRVCNKMKRQRVSRETAQILLILGLNEVYDSD